MVGVQVAEAHVRIGRVEVLLHRGQCARAEVQDDVAVAGNADNVGGTRISGGGEAPGTAEDGQLHGITVPRIEGEF